MTTRIDCNFLGWSHEPETPCPHEAKWLVWPEGASPDMFEESCDEHVATMFDDRYRVFHVERIVPA